MDAIKTTSLTKYYGRARGITDMNLTVEQGDFFGFIGPNGAGKSTTIRTLLGLTSPSERADSRHGYQPPKRGDSLPCGIYAFGGFLLP